MRYNYVYPLSKAYSKKNLLAKQDFSSKIKSKPYRHLVIDKSDFYRLKVSR